MSKKKKNTRFSLTLDRSFHFHLEGGLDYSWESHPLPFWCVGPGVCAGPHQGLDGVEEVSLCDVANTALIYQQKLHQLHGKRDRHVMQSILHRLEETRENRSPCSSSILQTFQQSKPIRQGRFYF